MKRGFTLIELLVIMAIIGILTAVVLASMSSGGGKEKAKTDAQTEARASCVKQGGVPILDNWDDMTDCKFKPSSAPYDKSVLAPCNGSDLPIDMPIETKRAIQDARRGECS